MDQTLEDIRKIELDRIDYHKLSDRYFHIIERNIPILISAPHGAKHLRQGAWKEEDEYTSAMAIKLGELTGAHVIYVKNKTVEDPNFDESSEYKRAIKNIVDKHGIKFLADIHGADKERDYKVNVGIIDDRDMKRCSCPKLKPIIKEAFKGFQEPLFNLDSFTESSPGTVTYFARNICGIEAAQFEINAKFRIVERKPNSSKAQKGTELDFKAEEKDVLEMIKRLEKMLLVIAKNV